MSAARGIGAAATVAMHAVALAALLAYEPARSALLAAAPIMVDLILPARVEPPRQPPPAQPPKPLPVARHSPPRPEPLPVLATPSEEPAAYAIPSPPQVSVPVAAVAPPVVPVSAPVFNADYLQNPAPVYPRLARKLGEQGRVILRVLVNAGGTADEVQVQTTSGHARLDDAARETVRAWKFVPARRGSETVPAWVLIPISFKLEG